MSVNGKGDSQGNVKVKAMGISFFALCPLTRAYTGPFQNGVFPTNQWNSWLKPIYTILKRPLDLTVLGHSKKEIPIGANELKYQYVRFQYDVSLGISGYDRKGVLIGEMFCEYCVRNR
jgi:hypothetical protein